MRFNNSLPFAALTGCLSLICVLMATWNASSSPLTGQLPIQVVPSNSDLNPPKSLPNPLESISEPTKLQPVPPSISSGTPNDPSADPLFIEIQRMIMNQGKSLERPAPPTSPDRDTRDTKESAEFKSITQNRWHAVERCLSAARALEEDMDREIANGETDKAILTADAIRSLRYQAWSLLHPESHPQQLIRSH